MAFWRIAALMILVAFSGITMAESDAEEEAGAGPEYSYLAMTPPFVVTIGDTAKIAYLKAEVSLRVKSAQLALVELHMPALRHELVMLLSAKLPDELEGAATRELIRQQALAAVRSVLEPDGEAEAIRDLLFTNFIVQR